MPDPPPARLTVQVAIPEADAEELDRATRQLLGELREHEVASAELALAGAAPEGTKSAEAALIGALALTVLPNALSPVVGLLKDWAGRAPGRTVKIRLESGAQVEYDPAAMTPEQLKALMEALAVPAAGGASVAAGRDVNVGQDAVGRDKVEVAGPVIHAAPGATVVVTNRVRPKRKKKKA